MAEENKNQEFRLKSIYETRNYFIKEKDWVKNLKMWVNNEEKEKDA